MGWFRNYIRLIVFLNILHCYTVLSVLPFEYVFLKRTVGTVKVP